MITEGTKRAWRKQLSVIMEANEVCCIELNNWESEFLDSIEIQLSNGRDLSFKQSSSLRKIYDKIS